MMTAENQGEAELTNQQKFHTLRRKMIVEVRLLSHSGAGERWFEAVIKDTNKEGAYCQLLNSPGQKFHHWREIRICSRTELPRQSATLGEVARLHAPAPELSRREPMPPPAALAAAIVPRTAPPPLVTLVRQPSPSIPPPSDRTSVSGRVLPVLTKPGLSNAGDMIRAARFAASQSQSDLALRLARAANDPALTNKRLSRLEVGSCRPSEAEILALVEVLKLDLDELIAACDRDDAFREKEKRNKAARESALRRRHERAAEDGRVIVPRASLYRPTVTPDVTRQKAAPQKVTARHFAAFEDFIEALVEIVPMHGDAEARRAWFRAAKELFRISGGG